MATMSASNFGGRLTHTDGLYFAVTVFSTVGFGDITAKTQASRLVVTGQMITDLVILAFAVKIILGAVRRHRPQQPIRLEWSSTTLPTAMPSPGNSRRGSSISSNSPEGFERRTASGGR